MTLQLQQFFALLRGGLWIEYTPDPRLFQTVSWEALYTLARQQTVSALVWDGIQKLPYELFPPSNIRMKWLGLVVQIERANQIMNERLSEITQIYQNKKLRPILLKGQSLAALYPNPLHRECGDIDLLFLHDEYTVSIKTAPITGNDKSHESEKHFHFNYKGIPVENHRFLISLYDRKQQKRIDDTVQALKNQSLPNHNTLKGKINILPDELNVHFVFLHMFHHFMVCGLGLRQICDWVLLLDKHPIERYTDYRPLIYWQLFGDIAVRHLGLSSEKMIHHKTFRHRTRWLVSQIIKDGNFGKNDPVLNTLSKKPYWIAKTLSFSRKLLRYPLFIALSPLRSLSIIVRYIATTLYVTFQRRDRQ